MFRSAEGSTRQLVQLCTGYFITYIITGITVKYFLGIQGMKGFEFLVYGTGAALCVPTFVCIAFKWYKFETDHKVNLLGIKMPVEFLYIIPSGIFTAIIIPTTTLMYSLPISVMVAMIIMRASVIIISRVVDGIQIRKGYLHKKVYKEENLGVLFAVSAMCVHLFFAREGGFDFLTHVPALIIFSSYIVSYAFRIYIMNYYKNVAAKGKKRDNKAFFAIEQFAAASTLVILAIVAYNSINWFGWDIPQVRDFRSAFQNPHENWGWAAFWGSFFGMAAFFSVFIFIFKGRTATFAGLVNRLTSLVAGTSATLLFWAFWGGKFPKPRDWMSLAFVLVAIYLCRIAEKKRAKELIASHEIEEDPADAPASQSERVANNA